MPAAEAPYPSLSNGFQAVAGRPLQRRYHQEGGSWALYWDEGMLGVDPGWWLGEPGAQFGARALLWAAGLPSGAKQVPRQGWQVRGYFGASYQAIPIEVILEEVPEAPALVLLRRSQDRALLTILFAEWTYAHKLMKQRRTCDEVDVRKEEELLALSLSQEEMMRESSSANSSLHSRLKEATLAKSKAMARVEDMQKQLLEAEQANKSLQSQLRKAKREAQRTRNARETGATTHLDPESDAPEVTKAASVEEFEECFQEDDPGNETCGPALDKLSVEKAIANDSAIESNHDKFASVTAKLSLDSEKIQDEAEQKLQGKMKEQEEIVGMKNETERKLAEKEIELANQVSEFNTLQQRLSDELAEMDTRRAQIELDRDGLKVENAKLVQELESMRSETADKMQAHKESLSKTLADLQNDHEDSLEELPAKTASIDVERQRLQEDMKALQSETERKLQAKDQEMSMTKANLQHEHAQRLKEKEAELASRRADFSNELQLMLEQKGEVRKSLEQVQSKHETLLAEKAALEQEMEALRTSMLKGSEAKDKELADLQGEHAEKLREVEAELQWLRSECNDRANEAMKPKKDVEDVAEAAKNNQAKEDEQEHIDRTRNETERKLEELQSELAGRVSDFNTEKQRLSEALAEMDKRRADAESDCAAFKENAKLVSDLRTEQERLSDELAEMDKRRAGIESDRDSFKADNEKLKSELYTEQRRLSEELAEMEKSRAEIETDRERLKADNEKLKSDSSTEQQRLSEELAEMAKRRASAESDRANLETDNAKLKSDLSTEQQRFSEELAKMEKMRADIESDRDSLKADKEQLLLDYNTKKQTLSKELAEMDKWRTEIDTDRDSLKADNAKLKSDFSIEQQRMFNELAMMDRKRAEIESDRDRLQADNAKLMSGLNREQQLISEELTEANKRKAELKSDRDRVEAENAKLMSNFKTEQQRLLEELAVMDKMRAEVELARDTFKADNAKLVSDFDTEKQRLSEELAVVEKRRAEMETDRDRLKAENENLRSEFSAEQQRMSKELATMDRTKAEVESDRDRLQADNAKLISGLNREQQLVSEELAEAKKREVEVESDRDRLQAENAKLMSDFNTEQQRLLEELAVMDKRRAEVELARDSLKADNAKLVSDFDTEKQRLSEELAVMEKTKSDIESDCDSLKADIARLNQELKELHSETAQKLQANKEEVSRVSAELQKEYERSLADKEEELTHMMNDFDVQRQRLLAEMESVRSETEHKLQTKDMELSTATADLQQEHDRKLSEKDAELKSKVAVLDQERQRMLQQKIEVENALEMMTDLAQEKEDTMSTLQKEHQRKLEEKDAELASLVAQFENERVQLLQDQARKLEEAETLRSSKTTADLQQKYSRRLKEKEAELSSTRADFNVERQGMLEQRIDMEKQLKDIQSKYDKLATEKTVLAQEINDLQAPFFDQLKAKDEELSELASAVSNFESERLRMLEHQAEMERQLAVIKSDRDGLASEKAKALREMEKYQTEDLWEAVEKKLQAAEGTKLASHLPDHKTLQHVSVPVQSERDCVMADDAKLTCKIDLQEQSFVAALDDKEAEISRKIAEINAERQRLQEEVAASRRDADPQLQAKSICDPKQMSMSTTNLSQERAHASKESTIAAPRKFEENAESVSKTPITRIERSGVLEEQVGMDGKSAENQSDHNGIVHQEEKGVEAASKVEEALQQQLSPERFGSENTDSPVPASSGDPFTMPRLKLHPKGAKPSGTSAHLQNDQPQSIENAGEMSLLDKTQLRSWDQLKDNLAIGHGCFPDAGEPIAPISAGKGTHTPRGSDASSFCSQNRKKLTAPLRSRSVSPIASMKDDRSEIASIREHRSESATQQLATQRSRSVSPIASMKDDRSEIASLRTDRLESASVPNRSVSPIGRRADQPKSGSQMNLTMNRLSKSLLPQDDIAGSEQGSILHVATPRDSKFTPRSHVSALTPRDIPTPRSRVSAFTPRDMPTARSHGSASAVSPRDVNMISPRSHVSVVTPRDAKLPASRSHFSALRPVESDLPSVRSRSVSPIGSCHDDNTSSVASLTGASKISALWSSSSSTVPPVSSRTTQLIPKLAIPGSLKRQEDRVGDTTGSNRSVSPLMGLTPRQRSAR
eukprot:TRINITY_DN1906_c0_g1_i3.p1 TRINITY_DN1906_c0_g1~~TRINITY_DN1906_c0_g1_i3.p1  ORF type:complete len:2122 (+),score=553.44 TRINITY_DN1906_c0_g1_i3:716-7081(+)